MKYLTLVTGILALLSLYGFYMSTKNPEPYQTRLQNIASHVNRSNTTWTAEDPSRFNNINLSAIKKLMGFKQTPISPENQVSFTAEELADVPASFDSRTQWPKCESIKEVRDQSACGSCWAFAASEAMSDRVCISSGQTDQTRISSEDLAFCCTACGSGCDGGSPFASWDYFRSTGIVTGDLYGNDAWCKPYTLAPCAHHVHSAKYPDCGGDELSPQCTKKCNAAYHKSYNSDKRFGTRAYGVNGVKNMMKEVSSNGPISVGINVFEDFLTYKTGVYQHTTGEYLGGHAVKILGYGTEDGTDYWLVANSWNESWGDKGFIKFIKGKNGCGIESSGSAGLIKK